MFNRVLECNPRFWYAWPSEMIVQKVPLIRNEEISCLSLFKILWVLKISWAFNLESGSPFYVERWHASGLNYIWSLSSSCDTGGLSLLCDILTFAYSIFPQKGFCGFYRAFCKVCLALSRVLGHDSNSLHLINFFLFSANYRQSHLCLHLLTSWLETPIESHFVFLAQKNFFVP